MKLVPIQATDTTPQTINLLTGNNNLFASIDKCGQIKIYGEDSYISIEEARDIIKIADNFELFFSNIKN